MLVSCLTRADFEVTDAKDYLPGVSWQPEWLLACLEITQANRLQHLNMLWKEKGMIWMQSLELGNTSQWIEQDYGEEGVISLLGANLANFGDRKFRNKLLKPFPSTKRRIDLQEDVVRRVAERDHVKMEVRYIGGKGLVTFYLDAIVDASKGDIEAELGAIEKGLHSMKEAWKQVSAL